MIWQQSQFLQHADVCCQTALLCCKGTITARNTKRHIGIIYTNSLFYNDYRKIRCIFTAKFGEFMKLNKIKDVLDSKGISQTWLAKQLGKSFSTVNCYARNRM